MHVYMYCMCVCSLCSVDTIAYQHPNRAGRIGLADLATAGPKFTTIKIFMKPNPIIDTNFDSKGLLFYIKGPLFEYNESATQYNSRNHI